jgi:hypothetical protein
VWMIDHENDETEAAWMASIAADFASFDDDRIHVRPGEAGFITDAVTRNIYRRPDVAQFLADAVRVPRQVWPASPNDRNMQGITLTDTTGALIGHDEGAMGSATGLSDQDQGNRFGCIFRPSDPNRRTQVFTTHPWVMFTEGGRIFSFMGRRIANSLRRDAAAVAFTSLGGTAFYTPADPDAVPPVPAMLTESARGAIRTSIFAALSLNHRDDIGNWSDDDPDTGLVQVDSVVTVNSGLVRVPVTLAPVIAGYVIGVDLTLAIQV